MSVSLVLLVQVFLQAFGIIMYIATKCNKVEKFNALRLYDILAVAIIGGSTVSSIFGILGHKEMCSLDIFFGHCVGLLV